jgi:hypothetical protein
MNMMRGGNLMLLSEEEVIIGAVTRPVGIYYVDYFLMLEVFLGLLSGSPTGRAVESLREKEATLDATPEAGSSDQMRVIDVVWVPLRQEGVLSLIEKRVVLRRVIFLGT